jgi:transposase
MITISNDAHLKTSTLCVLQDGQKVIRKKLNNDPDELLSFVRQFRGKKQYSMEATYNWPVFYELFKEEVDQFHLLHAKKLKAIVQSQGKCDKRDAEQLAYLTDIGYIPKAYTANAETRQVRHLLRTFIRISGHIVRLKNRIHAIINTNTFYSQRPKNFKNIFCKRGLAYIRELNLPAHHRYLIDQLLEQIICMQELKSSLLDYIEGVEFHHEDMEYLRTVPGMGGRVLINIIMAEIDNIDRFDNARALVAYAGLIPKDKSSGGKTRRGKLRTDRNPFLQWAMLESTAGAIIRDPGLKRYYKEVKQRSHCSSAKVAVARRVLTAIFYVLKEKRPYYLETNRE